jgi:hypothetical protein
VKGASKPRVTFTVESNGTTRSTTVTGSTSGVATASITAPYSGKITARYAGDTGHVGSAAVKAYTSPSRTTLTQSGYYKTVKGVRYYRSVSAVKLKGMVAPAGYRQVTLRLEVSRNGTWSWRTRPPATRTWTAACRSR